jgi:hypothetical protein
VPGCTLTTRVAAPVREVFALFTDFAHAAGRVRGIKKVEVLTPGPVGVGTRFRETRVLFNREATEEMEVTAFEPGRGYTLGCQSCGAVYASAFRFEPDGDGTLVTLDFEARARSLLAKLMAPLSFLMMGTVKKCIRQDLDDLKKVAETAVRGD